MDSPALVNQLGTFFAGKGQQLRVLIELGVGGGRAGTRTEAEMQTVIDAIGRWRGTLLLCGVEVYEGVLKDEGGVRTYLQQAVDALNRLRRQGAFVADERPIVSGAGSPGTTSLRTSSRRCARK